MSNAAQFNIRPEIAQQIRWFIKPGCGESGCPDPECCCSLCGKPIGVSDDDPRWDDHDENCIDCDVCRDAVPLILFRGEGKPMLRAQFHTKCFEKVVKIG